MSVPAIDYIDAMPAADLRTDLRNAYATTSALNREIEMLHRMIRRQKAQRDALLEACEAVRLAMFNIHAAEIDSMALLNKVSTAIATAKGGADVEVLK